MSELKGQILGIVLVIALFGVVATAMRAAFTTYSNKIGESVTEYAPEEGEPG
ncbi:MAG: hypothetical protein K6C32_02015 [Bacilli bacterium]|nr:hypothetical protein [Bacilli bacterium]